MNVARSVAEVLDEHTTLELECIDRLYLNVYVPLLHSPAGVAHFFRHVRGYPVPSSALMAPMTRRFVEEIAPASSPTGSSRRCTWTTSTRASSSTTRKGAHCAPRPSSTTPNDFAIGRWLCNLDDLKQVGFTANRRLLRVQRLSHDCPLGVQTFEQLHRPAVVDDRRVSALRFGDPRIQALLAALLVFRLLPMRAFSVFDRDWLRPGMAFEGPAIVEEAPATTTVDEGGTVEVDVYGSLISAVDLEEAP